MARANASVCAHKLFPAFASVWCAALFGLGSLAISSRVLGSVVMMTGLPAIVPATAPPLGFTAHALFALMLAMIGGVIGAGIGIVLGRSAKQRLPGSEYAPLRRSASPNAAQAPAPTFAPDTSHNPDTSYNNAPKVRARDAHPDAPPRRPLELTEDLVAGAILRGSDVNGADNSEPNSASSVAPATVTSHSPIHFFSPEAAAPAGIVIDQLIVPDEDPLLLSELAPDEHTPVEVAPVEVAPSGHSVSKLEGSEPAPSPLQNAAINAALAAGLTPGDGVAQQMLAELPLNGLGMVQLIERLALALDHRRNAGPSLPASAAPVAAEAAPVPGHDEPSPPPAALSPALSQLTERCASLLAAAPTAPALIEAAKIGADPVSLFSGFSGAKSFNGQTAARSPACSFTAAKAQIPSPRPAYASAQDADDALRAALATLKQMTAKA